MTITVHRILIIFLVSAGLLSWPFVASGQVIPQTITGNPPEKDITSLTALLSTDADIDREIGRIRARVDKLLAQSTGAGGEATPGGMPSLSASPDEVHQHERITSELLVDLDRQIDALNELKGIRKDNASYELERKSWKGFGEKPPYPGSLLDDIRDSLLSQRLELQTFELRLSLSAASFKRFDEDLKKSRQALRFAEEQNSRSAGTSEAPRKAWLLTLAQLQNDRNETGLVYAEIQRLAFETAIKGKRLQIAFLEEQLGAAETSSPLTKEDLEKRLDSLDKQRRDLETGLVSAERVEADARKRLDVIRNVLGSLPSEGLAKSLSQDPARKMIRTLAPFEGKSMSPEDKLQLLRLDLEAEQAFVETARQKVIAFKAQIQFVNAAERIWQDRYWLTQKRDLRDIRRKKAEVAENAARMEFLKKFADSSLSIWMNLIKNQKDRIASLKKSDPAAKLQELILKAYEERQDITLDLIEGLGRLDRLYSRLNDELTRRIKEAPISGRLREYLQTAYSFVKALWNTELYVATETTIVEDRSIVKPVSVTVGKVVKALIILIIGTWIAAKIGRAIQWALTKRLHWDKNETEPLRKVMVGVMFIVVSVIALVTVNIPLAVFAFLGGALAIGLGFGAQNLINNFISGLILLFDRSIRVGDIVEVDGQGGRVTEIGMRNSHIRRFDGIDLLVPNSQFLQQKVTNWTLSDLKMRYSITVGVAYGSPTRETERIIRQTIEAHPMVLKDPPPTILFEQFGDSALMFTGYFWMDLLSNRDNRLAVSEIRHELNTLLEKAGIVISFPQRDVHLDSSKPLEVRVLPPEDEKKK